MRYELPLQLNTLINSECWTFIRTSIIETLPFGMEWMCNHLAISAKRDGGIIFGVQEKPYTLTHYTDLLEIKSKNSYNIENDDIIQFIIAALTDRTYVSILVYMPLIYGYYSDTITDSDFHDYIAYGYDTDKQCILMALFNSKLGFFPKEIPYSDFKKSYEIMVDYIIQRPDFALLQSRVNAFPVTKMKAKPYHYQNNIFLCDSLNTIKEYITPKKYLVERYDDKRNMVEAYSGYSELGCLIGLVNLLDKYFSDHEMWKGMRELHLSAKKIHERHTLMEILLNQIQKKTGIVSPVYNEMLVKYHDICKDTNICFKLVLKFRLSANEGDLHRLRDKYADIYNNEYLLLNDVYSFLCTTVRDAIFNNH